MKRMFPMVVVALALTVAAGCSGSTPVGVVVAAPSPVAASDVLPSGAAPGDAATPGDVPAIGAPSSPCPLTTDDVSSVLERPVQQRGPACVFTAGESTITIEVIEFPGSASVALSGARAGVVGRLGNVRDLPLGDRAFFSSGAGFAQVTGQSGTTLCTVSMTRLPYDRDGYLTVGGQLLEATIG